MFSGMDYESCLRGCLTSRKLAILILEEISILNSKNLKILIIFFCILEHLGPSLLEMYEILSLWYNPICIGSMILLRVFNIYKPTKSGGVSSWCNG